MLLSITYRSIVMGIIFLVLLSILVRSAYADSEQMKTNTNGTEIKKDETPDGNYNSPFMFYTTPETERRLARLEAQTTKDYGSSLIMVNSEDEKNPEMLSEKIVDPEAKSDTNILSDKQLSLSTIQSDLESFPLKSSVTLSEKEQDSYIVGVMIAEYARSVFSSLDKIDVHPDKKLVTQGIMASLSDSSILDEATEHTAMTRFSDKVEQKQEEKKTESIERLSSLAGKLNTIEKKDDRVWVLLKKGMSNPGKDTVLKLSWEGMIYNGEIFDRVADLNVKQRDALPVWLQQAIRMAKLGGQVRLFILAGSLGDDVTLPPGTASHEIIQYTITVDKV